MVKDSPLACSSTNTISQTRTPPQPHPPSPEPVTLLILGAGWTSQFLLPLLTKEHITHAATTTTGRDGTIKFIFSPTSTDPEPYRLLPHAAYILITFPLKGEGSSTHLRDMYAQTHGHGHGHGAAPATARFVQLGSTGIYQIPGQACWVTRHSEYDRGNERARAEDELRAFGGCVLSLSGLWGGERQPRSWVSRVAASKEMLAGKKSLHLIHGADVARAIVAVVKDFTPGERWMLTDLLVYDWWELILGWCGGEDGKEPLPQLGWLRELMDETDTRALPRSSEELGRCYDSREFWDRFRIMPVRARL